jgi:hypothetical protein
MAKIEFGKGRIRAGTLFVPAVRNFSGAGVRYSMERYGRSRDLERIVRTLLPVSSEARRFFKDSEISHVVSSRKSHPLLTRQPIEFVGLAFTYLRRPPESQRSGWKMPIQH